MAAEDREGRQVLRIAKQLAADFPDGLVFIGGIAVYLHTKKYDEKVMPPEFTHDADMAISLTVLSELRDLGGVTKTERLHKRSLEIEDVDIDLYIERESGLRFDFEDLASTAEQIGDITVADIPHLLLLKLDALAERGRSEAGSKDRRDVAKLLVMLETYHPSCIVGMITDDDIALLKKVLKSNAFREITKNQATAAKLRRRAAVIVDRVVEVLS